MIKIWQIGWAGGVLALAIVSAAFISGFFYGKNSGRDKLLQKTIAALYDREKINEATFKLDDIGLCVALGGVPDDCTRFLRRLGKAATGE